VIKLRAALVALAAIALALGACSAPAYAASSAPMPAIAVHLWRHALTEPGTLGVTITATSCITVAEADAVRDGGRHIVYSGPQHERGKTVTLHFRFTRHRSSTSPTGAKPGPWAVTQVSYYRCQGDPEGVPLEWTGHLGFYLHARKG
jgi:hypothetical protein